MEQAHLSELFEQQHVAEQAGIPQFNSTSLALRRDCSSCINLCRLRKKAAAPPIRAKMSKIKITVPAPPPPAGVGAGVGSGVGVVGVGGCTT
mmetsp:Transcript_7827/g.17605  ORF Transcript_7827/g.17605 Transcript_7827/m.17605 type:complete len:92 (-) Transcript_7827:633-908(-)